MKFETIFKILYCPDPGYEDGVGPESSMLQLLMIVVLWIIIALLLFMFRYLFRSPMSNLPFVSLKVRGGESLGMRLGESVEIVRYIFLMCVCWGGGGRHWTHLIFQTPFVAHIDPKVKWCLLDNHPRFYHSAFR